MSDKKTQQPQHHQHDGPGRPASELLSDPDGGVTHPGRLRARQSSRSFHHFRHHPLRWAIPLPRLFHVRFRIHLIFMVFIAVVVARTVWPLADHPAGGDFTFPLLGLSALFIVLIIRESFRLIISRSVGGTSNTITLYPLGSLRPPYQTDNLLTDILTIAAGPLINLTFILITTPILAMWVMKDWSLMLYNPFDPVGAYSMWCVGGRPAVWAVFLWWVNEISLLLLIINLLPMQPLDGSHLLERAVAMVSTRRRAAETTSLVGYTTAFALMAVALTLHLDLLLALAMLGMVLSWQKGRVKQFAFEDELEMDELSDDDIFISSKRKINSGGKQNLLFHHPPPISQAHPG